jgi:class 3 adenylate cyclase
MHGRMGKNRSMDSADLRHRLMAILVADAVGYSRLMSIDDRATVLAIEAARGVFRAHTLASGGRVIDTAGDSVLAVFDTATGAVTAALAVQRARWPILRRTFPKAAACAFASACTWGT